MLYRRTRVSLDLIVTGPHVPTWPGCTYLTAMFKADSQKIVAALLILVTTTSASYGVSPAPHGGGSATPLAIARCVFERAHGHYKG